MKITELLTESAKKGLYYYVNKRKKAGTSRSKNNPKAPSEQDWKNAAKTAKNEGGNPRQAAIAIAKRESGKYNKDGERIKEDSLLDQEFDLIESIIEKLAEHNGVDAEVIWEDLESLTEDELYAFAVTSEPIMESQGVAEGSDFFAGSKFADEEGNTFSVEKIIAFAKKNPKYFHKDFPLSKIKHDLSWWQGNKERMMNADTSFPLLVIQNDDGHLGVADGLNRMKKAVDVEKRTTIDVYLVPKKDIMKFSEKQGVAEDWQKANKRDKTDGMSQKAVNAYRRENPGSKLKTAVTTKPSKLKKGSKASKRRSSYCSRSRGQMKMHSISCSKTPDKAICKARRRWNC